MDWARIMAPLSGGEGDRRVLAGAVVLARAFDAELLCVHAPADLADMAPWVGDGFMGGVQTAGAVDSLRQAAEEGERVARASVEALGYDKSTFESLRSPVWAALAMAGRLSDVVVFDDLTAKGRGPLDRAFKQIVADEQRPTLVIKGAFKVGGVAAVAWDGGKEAGRAVRTALPLLRKASSVIVLTAPAATQRKIEPDQLDVFLAARGVTSQLKVLADAGDPAQALLRATREAGADVLVAGAFSHTRLREFIFGGATRAFLGSESPSLFLSH
jgi:nucleotide-binding universal stress UspA family protein